VRGDTTYYRRIQVLLELSGARSPRSAEDFIQGIVRRSPPNFVFHRWDADKEEVTPQCSESAIRKAFDMAVQLGLLDRGSAALTTQGAEAADPGQFDSVLRRRIRSHLQQAGCAIESVEDAARRMLQSRKIQLPTADELYVAVCSPNAVNLSQSEFCTLVRLLAACGGIRICRRHLYLPMHPKRE